MADHSAHGSAPSHNFEAHRSTYEAFITGSVALTLLCLYTLVSLVIFRFGGSFHVFLGFAGLVVGVITVLIDVKTGGKRWFLSGGALVLFGLVTAMSVA
jgi:hypothetical protein